MEPPTDTVILVLHTDWTEAACPLDVLKSFHMDEVVRFEIRAKQGEPDGVTKDDLIRGIGEALYGGSCTVHGDAGDVGATPSSFNWIDTMLYHNPKYSNSLYIGYKATL